MDTVISRIKPDESHILSLLFVTVSLLYTTVVIFVVQLILESNLMSVKTNNITNKKTIGEKS